MLDLPSEWKTLFNALSPWVRSTRQLVLAGPDHNYILAGWSEVNEKWMACHWRMWDRRGHVLTESHEEMVAWCEQQTRGEK